MSFKITICEIDTGIVLNNHGFRAHCGLGSELIFESEHEAIAEKDAALKRFMFVEVWLENIETGESKKYIDDDRAKKYYDERQDYFNYMYLPWYRKILIKKPILKYFDPNREK